MSTPNVEVRRQSAGLFDIRNIIGLLVLIYGVVLTIMGFGVSDEQLAKSAGWNVNLWAGIAMVLLGIFFIGWAYLRPVVVTTTVVSGEPTGEFE